MFIYNVSNGIKGSDGVLTFENSVLSPVLEITSNDIDKDFKTPAIIYIEFNKYVKSENDFYYYDYCLAKFENEKWSCVERCLSEDNKTFKLNSLGIYAVILNPLRYQKLTSASSSFIFQNLGYLLIIFAVVAVIVIITCYVISRISRFRTKYHNERYRLEALKRKKEEYQKQSTDVFGQTLGDNLMGLVYSKNKAYNVSNKNIKDSLSLSDEIDKKKEKVEKMRVANKRLNEDLQEWTKKCVQIQNQK